MDKITATLKSDVQDIRKVAKAGLAGNEYIAREALAEILALCADADHDIKECDGKIAYESQLIFERGLMAGVRHGESMVS